MKALIAIAMAATSMPAVAAASGSEQAEAPRERKVCTQIQRRSQSRVPARRVCLTATQWQDRYGPDWRQVLSGNTTPEDDYDAADVRSRVHSTMPTHGMGGSSSTGSLGPR